VQSASSYFEVYGELANRDGLGLATEIYLDDVVGVEKDLCLASLFCELNPFTRNRCDGFAILGAENVELILSVIRFEIVGAGRQLLSADRDGMINYELSRIGARPDRQRKS